MKENNSVSIGCGLIWIDFQSLQKILPKTFFKHLESQSKYAFYKWVLSHVTFPYIL